MKRLLLALLLALAPLSLRAATPTFVANGSAAVTGSATTCTPTMPGSIVANDILLLVACGEGNDAGGNIQLTTANGFVTVNGDSGDDNDALEESPECDCRVFWKRAVGGDAAPVVADSGDHTTCAVHQFRGARTSGLPWDAEASGNDSNANDTSAVIPGVTTDDPGTLIVMIQGTSNNATATTNCGAVTNGNLTNITEQFDSTNTINLGGGHCVITGEKATPGATGDSTLTLSVTSFKAASLIALTSGCGTSLALTGAGCP